MFDAKLQSFSVNIERCDNIEGGKEDYSRYAKNLQEMDFKNRNRIE